MKRYDSLPGGEVRPASNEETPVKIRIPARPRERIRSFSGESLIGISRALSRRVGKLTFAEPVAYVYNPLDYARVLHEAYLTRHGQAPKQVVLLGMNPGPFGMAQTGIPFGDVTVVRDFLRLDGEVGRPEREHPKRRVEGMACARSEVSGTRLWGWVRDDFGAAEHFFERFFVANYCPLVFMEASARNLTPDKLPRRERGALFAACDEALRDMVATLRPRFVVGVGLFAAERARLALASTRITIGTILHPSPASPLANRGWAAQARRQLANLGIRISPGR